MRMPGHRPLTRAWVGRVMPTALVRTRVGKAHTPCLRCPEPTVPAAALPGDTRCWEPRVLSGPGQVGSV